MTDADHHQPEVLEAHWDRVQVHALFDDLKQGAEVSHVQVRSTSSNNRPADATVTLDQAREMLDDNLAKAIQIYYEYDGKSWCDTLMPTSDTIHIVRTIVPPHR